MSYICARCGSEMKEREWAGEWECPSCKLVTIDHSEDDYSYEDVYDEKLEVCKVCDGDAYPDCKGGCPLIDE